MRERRPLALPLRAFIGITSSVALVGALIAARSARPVPRDAGDHAALPVAPAAPLGSEIAPPSEPAPALPAPATAAHAAPIAVDRAGALRDALGWSDDAARIEAVESAMAARSVDALPVLEAVALPGDPAAAPTIIRAVAALGREAGGGEQHRAAQTLGAWLGAESQRDAADARGNVSVLVDALGDLGGPDAAGALASALDTGALPLHVQTLAAQRLTALDDAAGSPALAQYAARVRALPPAEGIDELLRQEALALAAPNDDRP
jgi:hypothetical protein